MHSHNTYYVCNTGAVRTNTHKTVSCLHVDWRWRPVTMCAEITRSRTIAVAVSTCEVVDAPGAARLCRPKHVPACSLPRILVVSSPVSQSSPVRLWRVVAFLTVQAILAEVRLGVLQVGACHDVLVGLSRAVWGRQWESVTCQSDQQMQCRPSSTSATVARTHLHTRAQGGGG